MQKNKGVWVATTDPLVARRLNMVFQASTFGDYILTSFTAIGLKWFLTSLNYASLISSNIQSRPLEGMRTRCTSIEVRVPGRTFSLAEW